MQLVPHELELVGVVVALVCGGGGGCDDSLVVVSSFAKAKRHARVEYDDASSLDERELDGETRIGELGAPRRRDDGEQAIDRERAQQHRAQLQRGERGERDQFAQSGREVLEPTRAVTEQLPIHGRQIPAVEAGRVDQREHGQVAHGGQRRRGAHGYVVASARERVAREQVQRAHIARGAEQNDEQIDEAY